MEAAELLKKVRKIEIKTRGLSDQIFSGEYHAAFKGKGMTFSEVREYQFGDDIRAIDWNVTARFNAPYIKVFEEERELTVMLLIDVSASKEFGTISQFKQDLVTELSAVLAFSAIQNNDKIGVIFFSDVIEKFIPPKKGKSHILRIIRELITFEPINKRTDISEALRYFTNAIKKRSIAFVISDFMDVNFNEKGEIGEEALKIANKKHDIVAIRVYDQREQELPSVGLVKLRDAETGNFRWIDTSSKQLREHFQQYNSNRKDVLKKLFSRCGVDATSIRTDEPYVKPLMGLFKKRESRR
ncbi:MAG TPA: DUF58 domain-containing protein [Flavobacteriales bacterium]|nr:DUF58 domain-containing protein [Flavobacteriales bacterium]HIA12076.1 DUF58 domain-containing protein [Flavobacteriales bacterium]HIO73545.1 DUF58 domain-containing protein [Flavobacteriales bacterium]